MKYIQAELHNLRRRTDQGEFIMRKDEKVKKLEAQITWFRNEALHLTQKVSSMKS